MLRWLFLLLLLANALVFFWYAQQRAAQREPQVAPAIGELRLLSELDGGEILPARERVCLGFAPLARQADAERLIRLLADQPVTARAIRLPAAIIGYRLTLPLPADTAARVALLDDLARQGWVPESRGGLLSFGTFSDLAELERVRAELPPALGLRTELRAIRATSAPWEVRVEHLSGYEISNEINKLILASWPGIKIEKKPCEGVASPQIDQ